ncbi:uncharacterized protein LOC110863312 isoform X4 [Folsomia candida]|nr:uncharacterized protein LOC110863312 isoform X3 [Folsomia candida]XP_035708781.1 uncharacterized protein LOC110863312 isoform X4 [Folsomia candida]
MASEPTGTAGGDEDVNIFDEPSSPPEEEWREKALNWAHILSYLHTSDNVSSASVASCLALNKDIAFLVDQEVIRAHSFILQIRSAYFSRALGRMFLRALKGLGQYEDEEGYTLWELKPLPIPANMTDPESFKAMIQFMYTEELDEQQSDDKLCGLLKAGKRFEVKLLENRCEDLLYKRLNIQNMLNIYEVAELLNKQPLMECCFSLMIKNGDMFFESPDFTKISHGLLCKLLGNDDLCVQENNIFDSCLRWARAQLQRLGKEENGQNLRGVLDPAHTLIRFPLLHQEFIVQGVQPLGLLLDSELLEITIFFLSRNENGLKTFSSKNRCHKVIKMKQEKSTSQQSNEYLNTKKPLALESNNSFEQSSSKVRSQPSQHTQINLTSINEIQSTHPGIIDIVSDEDRSEAEEGEIRTEEVTLMDATTTTSTASNLNNHRQKRLVSPDSTHPPPNCIDRHDKRQDTEQEQTHEEKKRKLDSCPQQALGSQDIKQVITARPSNSQLKGWNNTVTVNGNFNELLSIEELRERLKSALQNLDVHTLEDVFKIRLYNVFLSHRRDLSVIVVPNLCYVEIVVDSSRHAQTISTHPDNYLVFSRKPGPQVLDSDLWNSPIRICMWENGIRRFELNPNEHTLFINIREGQTASNIVRKLAVDIPTKYTIEKLALCRTIFHSKVDPKKLTSLVIHRCEFGRTDILRDCCSLELLSWIGIIEKDIMDLVHLTNVANTLKTLSLCNVTVAVGEGGTPSFRVLETIHFVMCKWDEQLERQLGILAPAIRKLFITAPHNFMPSNLMATAFLKQMTDIENVIVTYVPSCILKCDERKTEGVRFLKFFESNVQVNNTNTTDIVIPRNGFRLSRKLLRWTFFHLPSNSSNGPSLTDKEFFDYFLLSVFSRDCIAYFRETVLECKHASCPGRYFQQGNITSLCLHEQSMSDKYNNVSPCCAGGLSKEVAPKDNARYQNSVYK